MRAFHRLQVARKLRVEQVYERDRPHAVERAVLVVRFTPCGPLVPAGDEHKLGVGLEHAAPLLGEVAARVIGFLRLPARVEGAPVRARVAEDAQFAVHRVLRHPDRHLLVLARCILENVLREHFEPAPLVRPGRAREVARLPGAEREELADLARRLFPLRGRRQRGRLWCGRLFVALVPDPKVALPAERPSIRVSPAGSAVFGRGAPGKNDAAARPPADRAPGVRLLQVEIARGERGGERQACDRVVDHVLEPLARQKLPTDAVVERQRHRAVFEAPGRERAADGGKGAFGAEALPQRFARR